MARPVQGLHRAVVDDAADPMSRGRLRVNVPDVGVTGVWAEACLPPVPAAMFALPPVGSTVWVQFEGGDPHHPVWTGVLWDTAWLSPSTITSAGTVTVSAPMVRVEAASAEVSGVLKCDTLIANSVVASSYTPGSGNIW
jgi:hypothetical protein